MTDGLPRIWVLLGHRRGDNLQLLALAEALGLPFETRSLRYNSLRRLDNRILGARLASVRPSSRGWLRPPWPDLVIGTGHRSVPVARWIRRQSGERAKLVQLGNPRLHARHFDLVITAPQYPAADTGNVVRLPFAMGSRHDVGKLSAEEQSFFAALPRPHRLLILGGPNKHWRTPAKDMASAARRLAERCDQEGGAVIVTGSPRTRAEALNAVEAAVRPDRDKVVRGDVPRYAALLSDADEIYVTADSVSMLSEAVFTGKPVGMIPIRLSARGKARDAASKLLGPPYPNLRKMWDALESAGLVGTIDDPKQGIADDPSSIAAAAVLALLGRSRR